jgi:molecular chaperone GrpE (heat shock protein)
MNRTSNESKSKSKKLEENVKNLESRFKHVLEEVGNERKKLENGRVILHRGFGSRGWFGNM